MATIGENPDFTLIVDKKLIKLHLQDVVMYLK